MGPHVVHKLREAGSQSNQVEASGVHWVNANSGLVSVLSLGPLSKRLRAY